MNIFIIALFCFAFSAFLLGYMVFLKRRDELARSWFFYSTCCGLWATGYAFQINNSVEYLPALWASRFADGCAVIIPVAWIYFINTFLNRKPNKVLFRSLIVLSFLILLTVPTSLFIPYLKEKYEIGFAHFVHGGPAFHIFSLIFTFSIIYGFWLMFKAYNQTDITKERKDQIRLLLIGTAFAFFGGSLAFLPVYDIDIPVAYGTLLLPIFPFLMVLAITQYRFMDIEEVAKAAHRDKLVAIGTLATSINHEIRNPLYIIQGMADSFLVNREEGIYTSPEIALGKAADILIKMRDQATRAIDIMKSFAMFAKQTSDQEVHVDSVDLNQLFGNILPLINRELELEKIDLKLNIPDALPAIQADHRHAEQIFFNLIVNACQALKSGTSPCISISAHQQNGHINILVSDNGPGIPAGQSNKIFEPFYTTKEEGTGLGLYITKQLVERNSGRIFLSSKPGHGCEFTLKFQSKVAK